MSRSDSVRITILEFKKIFLKDRREAPQGAFYVLGF